MDTPASNISRSLEGKWEAWQYQGIVRAMLLNAPYPTWFNEIPTRKNGEYRSFLWDFSREIQLNDWIVRFEDGPTFKLYTPEEFAQLCTMGLAHKAGRAGELERALRELLPLAINETERNEHAEGRDNEDYGSKKGRQAIATAEALLEGRPVPLDVGDPLDIAYIGIGAMSGILLWSAGHVGQSIPMGQLELVDEAIRHAPLLAKLYEARSEELDTLVFAYDVAQAFGEYYARTLLSRPIPDQEVDAQLILDLVVEKALLASMVKETVKE